MRLWIKLGGLGVAAAAATITAGTIALAGHGHDDAAPARARNVAETDHRLAHEGGRGSLGHRSRSASPSAPARHAPASSAAPRRSAAPARMAAITVVASGGIAGKSTTITIDTTGRWTVEASSGDSASGRLTRDQMRALDRLTGDPALRTASTAKGTHDQCTDQVTTAVTTRGFTVRTDCNTDPGDAFLALVKRIASYIPS